MESFHPLKKKKTSDAAAEHASRAKLDLCKSAILLLDHVYMDALS